MNVLSRSVGRSVLTRPALAHVWPPKAQPKSTAMVVQYAEFCVCALLKFTCMNRPKEQVGKNANTVADASQLSDPRNFGKADVNNSAQDSLFTSFVL